MSKNLERPILLTKLYIPEPRRETVIRRRLFTKLNSGLDKKLSLISAPAGFGKSTLLGSWIKKAKLNAGWLSLDSEDNDSIRFLNHFVTLFQKFDENIGKSLIRILESPQPQPMRQILSTLINELSESSSDFILVLDDYHQIHSKEIHDGISFFLEYQPGNVHLILSTREDPPLTLARMRALGEMNEIRASDLRFSSAELTEFFNQKEKLDLSQEDMDALEKRIEGWIAGLQLVAILLKDQLNKSHVIQSFTGNNRLVMDYLLEEVINRQPEHIQTFLLKTSILNQLTGSLCNTITNQKEGAQTLEDLNRANLFIVPLDNQGGWYRYHHLFADLLQHRLRQTKPEQLSILHSKASEWYKQNGIFGQAIEHAILSGNHKQAATLISSQFDVLWKRGEHAKLRKWLTALPEETLIKEPQLGSACAYYLHIIGRHNKGELLLQKVEQVLSGNGDPHPDGSQPARIKISGQEKKKLLGRISVIRGLIDSSIGNVKGMIKHANHALENLPDDDLIWRSITTFSLGDAYSFMGDMQASFKVRSETLADWENSGNPYYIIMASVKLAATLREQGKLKEAAEISQKQIAIAKEHSLSDDKSIGYLMTLWGEILVEWNDLARGFDLAQKGVEIAERNKNIMIMSFCYLNLLRVLFSTGNLTEMEALIAKIRTKYSNTPMAPWLPDQLSMWQARIWLVQGDVASASNWMKTRELDFGAEYELPSEIDFHSLIMHIVSARILISQNRLDEAIRLLTHLVKIAEKTDRVTSVIETRILLALAYQSRSENESALKSMEYALDIAESKGYFRIFIDEGPIAGTILKRIKTEDTKRKKYVRNILMAFEDREKPFISSDKQGLIEPLSERELEILSQIAAGLTNQQIADKLFLSRNTVKSHGRNIYQKLGVNSRVQAIQEARRLDLFQSN